MRTDREEIALKPSYGQEAIWVIERTSPGTPAYHQARAYRLRGNLEVERLGRAIQHLVQRHEILRASFPTRPDGSPMLKISREVAPILEVGPALTDGGGWGEEGLRQDMEAYARRPFDLEEAPLLRARVRALGEGEHLLEFVFHHAVIDGFSLGVFFRQLSALYNHPGEWESVALEPPSYVSYAEESRRRVDSGQLEGQLEYWLERLEDLPSPLELQHERLRPQMLSLRGATFVHPISRELVEGVGEVCSKYGVTPFVFTYALLQVLLHRYTGETDILVGAPVRTAPEEDRWNDAVGLFLNTVVLRSDLSGDPLFPDLLAQSFLTTVEALEHREFPFAKLVQAVRAQHTEHADQLFQVLLSFQQRAQEPLALAGLDGHQRLFVNDGGAQAELGFYVEWAPDDARIRVEYSTDLFGEAHVRRLMGHYHTLLKGAVAEPERRISDLPLLTDTEYHRLVVQRNDTERVLDGASVVEGIRAWADQRPSDWAVTQGETKLTYQDLAARSDIVARALVARGVKRGDIVGVCFERSPAMVVALLGVWKAGAAYLPLDPEFPAERLRFMVEDSGAALVLTDGVARNVLPEGVADILQLKKVLYGEGIGAPTDLPARGDLAYVIYTSGSTGRPKGVELEHGNLLNFITSMAEAPGLDREDVLLAVTTLSFDIAGLELWLPLWRGARVEIASEEEARDGGRLAERLEKTGATVMQATPATWRMLLDAGWAGRLRKILCGGEAFPRDLVAPLLERADEVWNMYGPTETTVWSTVARVEEVATAQSVPIGRPIANTRTYVMDRRGRLTPDGVPGELWIAGAGVARGYHVRPELTAERFVADPFVPGGRAYRTGDLVRWLPDGRLEHLGRLDNQVKVNGFRIELGEIEAVLGQHPDVRQTVVAVREAAGGDARLVAYVVWQQESHPLGSELRRYLRGSLPNYMIPGVVVDMDTLPLTPNGKIDRKRLPNPLESVVVRDYVPPRTEQEQAIAAVWSEMLGREQIGLRDNFFELGGHSLLAVRAVAAMEERAGIRVDPRAMFFQTLEQVANGAPPGDRPA